ncbi:hypothetical protein MBLNU230_g5176t1 [Neophaeotheca triangularis]
MSVSRPSLGPEEPDVSTEGGAAKARVALACQRCKRRKQRCDGVSPSCKSCLKAKAICTYEVPMRVRYPGGKSRYISALEDRIAMLEASMPEYSEDHLVAKTSSPVQQSEKSSGGEASRLSNTINHNSQRDEQGTSTVVDGVAFLSLSASGATDVASEPHYLGSSSGVTIARLLQASIFDDSLGNEQRRFYGSQASSPDADERSPLNVRKASCALPEINIASKLLKTFFEKLHTRWPLLDRRLYEDLFQQHWQNATSLTSMQRSMFHLVFAISARFHQLTRQSCEVDPDMHFETAVSGMDDIVQQHSLLTVQFISLLAIHGQRSPFGAGSWSQVRHAFTLAIDLGLHRKEAVGMDSCANREFELRRRVFWCCYCLDRETSITLGRSFAISDRDINAEMPSQHPDTYDLTESASPKSCEPVWTNILPFIHIAKLCRIQSKIHRLVFRVDKNILDLEHNEKRRLETKLATIGRELDAWVATVPKSPRSGARTHWLYDSEASYNDCSDYFNLQYHKTLLMLFTALLPGFQQGDSRIKAGAKSAVAICMAYKRLHQQKILTYTTIALHSCFVAGLTLIYCLWRDKTLFDYGSLEATHACTQALTIFAEKWPGAAKYRDVYDGLSGRVLRDLIGEQQRQSGLQQPAPPSNSAAVERQTLDEVHQDAPGGWQVGAMFDELVGTAFCGDFSGNEPMAGSYVDSSMALSGFPENIGEPEFNFMPY